MSTFTPSTSAPEFFSPFLPVLSIPRYVGDDEPFTFGDAVYRIASEQDTDVESPRDWEGSICEIFAPGGREYVNTDEISSFPDSDGVHRFDVSRLFDYYNGGVAYEIARLYLTGRDDVRAVFPLYGRGDDVGASLPAVNHSATLTDARRDARYASYLPTRSLLFDGLYGGEPDGIVIVTTEAVSDGSGKAEPTDAELFAAVEAELKVWGEYRRGEVYSVDVYRDVPNVDDDGRGPDGYVTESVEHLESCGGFHGDDAEDSGARAFIIETVVRDYFDRLPIRLEWSTDPVTGIYGQRPTARAEFLNGGE